MVISAKVLVAACAVTGLGVLGGVVFLALPVVNSWQLRARTTPPPAETTATSAVPPPPAAIQYDTGPATGQSAVTAKFNGQVYVVIPASEEKCFRIVDQRDFDGDGKGDALVAHVPGCGGNCCADTFFFVSHRGEGHFSRTEPFGNSWTDPQIGDWKGRLTVKVVSTNEGMNTDDAEEISSRYILENGQAVLVESTKRAELAALKEIRSSQVNEQNQELSLKYDLDSDGLDDELTGRLWQRWGRLILTVRIGNNPPRETDFRCKRIGVLESKTANVHDLVCDQDRILRWDGSNYVAPAEPGAPVAAPAPAPVNPPPSASAPAR